MIRNWLEKNYSIKKFTKSLLYARFRQRLPQPQLHFLDDRACMPDAEKVLMDWPAGLEKPIIGIIKDYDPYPRWTKCCRFLENNSFPYGYYDLQASDWMERAGKFDVFIGILSSDPVQLQEMRTKYFILENYLGKICFPSYNDLFLYENKTLEFCIGKATGIPFPSTYIFNNECEALAAIEKLHFPLISKIDPGSGSIGVECINRKKQAAAIIKKSFSRKGRATHSLTIRQKDYVYFQEFIPNDGFDIRVIVVGNQVFGYFRRVLRGDFRASGMDLVEKRELPKEALILARKINKVIKSPLIVVDMVHGLDGKYYVIEISPMCQMKLPEQLHVKNVAGVYIFNDDVTYHFQPGKYWVYELAIKEFFLSKYLPRIL